MSQVVLISTNEVVNSLYEINLRAYVDAQLVIEKDIEKALAHEKIDVLLCFQELSSSNNIYAKIAEKKVSVPVIVLGDSGEERLSGVSVIKNKYDIRSMLRAVAKILNVSAKDMASKEVPKFFPVPLKLLKDMKFTESNIYFRHPDQDEYFLIIEKNNELGDKLKKYIKEGIKYLYVDSRERLRFVNKASALVVAELERDDLTHADHIQITSQGMELMAEELFQNQEVSEEMAQISRACIESIQQVISEVPKLKGILKLLLEAKTGYVYQHSVLATYIASSMIKHMSWGSQEQQSKVAFALFFHDIYLIPLYEKYPQIMNEEDFLYLPSISEQEKRIVVEHASLASHILKNYSRCPIGADMIISQHHGMINGQGFAVNFKDDISPLSKVIIIAEEVALNIFKRVHEKQKDLLNYDVLVPMLREKYKNHTYQKIINAFEKVSF